LIAGLENRIWRRGLRSAWLGVEVTNPRARSLYERLGYEPFAEEIDGWEAQREDGSIYWYETEIILLRRQL
jgi:ribosomal protein S18 acetylase RimI-like enzyme